MLQLGIDEFIRNVKKNIMVILQLTIIFILSVMIVSVYESQTLMSNAVMKYIDDTGAYIDPNAEKWDENKVKNMPGVEEYIYANRTNMYVYSKGYDKEPDGNIYFAVYDEDKITYRPVLKSGKWYSDVDEKENRINVVISENTPDYDVGDIILAECFDDSGKSRNIELYVTGVVYERTMMFGHNTTFSNANNSYLSLFANHADVGNKSNLSFSIIGVMSMEDINKYSIVTYPGKGIVDYEDDISKEQINANDGELKDMAMVCNTTDMKKNSEKILYSKLGGITVVFAVLVIITIASIICSGAVTYLYEKRNYGIYFMTGNTWGRTICLSMINWIMVVLSSVILSVFIMIVGMAKGFFDKYSLIYSTKTLVVQLIIVMITLATAMVIPFIQMRRSQPVDIIRNND